MQRVPAYDNVLSYVMGFLNIYLLKTFDGTGTQLIEIV